jgi:hypothetical protein
MTLTRTEKARLKFLVRQLDGLRKRYERQMQTIENLHLRDEQDLNATLGAEVASLEAEITELQEKEGNQNGNATS